MKSLPSWSPVMIVARLTPSFPACARPTTQAFHISSPPQVAENLPRHIVARSRTGPLQVGQGEFAWEGFDCRLDEFCLGAAGAHRDLQAACEFAISRFEDKQQVMNRGSNLYCSQFMSSVEASMSRWVKETAYGRVGAGPQDSGIFWHGLRPGTICRSYGAGG